MYQEVNMMGSNIRKVKGHRIKKGENGEEVQFKW